MRFCFLLDSIEEDFLVCEAVVDQLEQWGHQCAIVRLDIQQVPQIEAYDAYIAWSISEDSTLSFLTQVEEHAIPVMNTARALRLLRKKEEALRYAAAHGIAVPPFSTEKPLAADMYPVSLHPLRNEKAAVVVETPSAPWPEGEYLLLSKIAKTVPDLRICVIGNEAHALRRGKNEDGETVYHETSFTPELLQLARQVGAVFDLDLYSLDIVETERGPLVVALRERPMPEGVQRLVSGIAEYVLHTAYHGREHSPLVPALIRGMLGHRHL
ncbi:hypothetical protein EI42_00683 [Thermosporothrix hazakensis]|jgi:hypothetical protein|uniref:Ribosomal protein S6--L-glutamate ligase n=1 Tax=Thermosporothrix hazakensis TaxID=644383 RepID=A0A326UDI7_THEHA|nr:hypothetical protein [Thermosporothrix hazakensis]PZW36507.1 hypothetical protein EI42_00683 [Thermosporothrix hazakensis]GCE47160.1 hypothetical protein KTH_20290 [Thermosporothrix hazakensis]